MCALIENLRPKGLVKLSGRISNHSKRREEAVFVLTSGDQTKMGIIAIAAAMAGMSGPAIATAGNASSVEEEADHIKFSLNGDPVEAWLWRSPFTDGDIVEIAAEWRNDHYEAYGIARPIDRTIALYPHCSRGRKAHFKNAVFWWFWLGIFSQYLLSTSILFFIMSWQLFTEPVYYIVLGGLGVFLAVMFFSLARKWLPFVNIAEKVFNVLGWNGASSVDLVKTSKAQRTEKDPSEFGTFYFRY